MKKTFNLLYAFKEYIVPLVVFIFLLGMMYAMAFAKMEEIPTIKAECYSNTNRVIVLEENLKSIKDNQEKTYAAIIRIEDKLDRKQDKK